MRAALSALIASLLLVGALGVIVSVEVFDQENALLSREFVDVEAGASGQSVMDATQALAWQSGTVEMGAVKMPVVTEISGLRAGLPNTAWVLTHKSGSGEVRGDNVAMGSVRVSEGDVLSWRFWSLSALAAATKKAKLEAAAAAPPEAAAAAAGQDEL
jgi:hypothetical protein